MGIKPRSPTRDAPTNAKRSSHHDEDIGVKGDDTEFGRIAAVTDRKARRGGDRTQAGLGELEAWLLSIRT
jgi:hypothetical protein